jgi:hypothetical protein
MFYVCKGLFTGCPDLDRLEIVLENPNLQAKSEVDTM